MMYYLVYQALADPYFKGLAKVEREPSSQPILKLEFEFERQRLTKEDVRYYFGSLIISKFISYLVNYHAILVVLPIQFFYEHMLRIYAIVF